MTSEPTNVLIVGAGIAALEGVLALRDLAAERVRITMLAPEAEFVLRPLTVREPFALSRAPRYPLAEIAADLDVVLRHDRFKWLDPTNRVVHTGGGEQLGYDVLLLALGARRYERFGHALTLDDARLDEQLHGIIQDIEGAYVRSVAFLLPPRMPWPLPIYELALQTAARAWEMNVELTTTIVTPEPAPLALFGRQVSNAVTRRLADARVRTILSAGCEVIAPGRVAIHPDLGELTADRLIALPELHGPAVAGVPTGAPGGFIEVDRHCRVRGLDDVYAAGDATDCPVKMGGIAAQQADTAAASIAAAAGASVTPKPLRATIEGILVGAGAPLALSATLAEGYGTNSTAVEVPAGTVTAHKLSARYLTPYLQAR